MPCPIGDIQDVPGTKGLLRRPGHPVKIAWVYGAVCVSGDHCVKFRRGVAREGGNPIRIKDGNKFSIHYPVAGDAAGDGTQQMTHLPLDLFQLGDIMENAMDQRRPIRFSDLSGLDSHPHNMAVTMPLAEFEFRNRMAPDGLL